ncbi:MAG TPA: TonB-dependent receptor [Rhodanobacteraceae bacterium]
MRHKLLCAAVLAAVSTGAMANAAAPVQATSLDPVVVTATRVDQPITQTLAPMTIITRQEIDRLQPKSLLDLLSGLPGVDLANSGGLGQQTSLFLRGTNSTHTLVLIDGVRVGSVGAGLAAWAQIPVDQIERIEIVRGPRSSLYGSDAVGGVVQIFTRHGKAGAGLTPSLRLSGGSHDSWDSEVGLSGGNAHGWFNVSVGAKYTHGINSCKLGAGTVFAGCFTNEPDKDGYRAYNGLLNGGWRFDNGAQLSGNFLRDTNFVAYDGSFQNYSRHAQQVAGARLALPVTDFWSMTISAGQSKDKATNFHDKTYVGYGNSMRNQASWLNTFTLTKDQQLTVGADYLHDHIASNTAYLRTRRFDTGVFAQYQGAFGRNEIQLSARHDHNQQFGNHDTGAAAWGYHFAHQLTLSASYATAFHAPTFNDLYYPSTPGFAPSADPHLKPEKSRNAEVDLSARYTHWHWQVSAYRNAIDDLIALNAFFTPGNISSATIRGLEGQLGGDWNGFTWATYLTWQKPENTDGGVDDGNWLPRRTQKSARFDLDRQLGAFSVGATFEAFGGRYDDIANTHWLGGYTKLALRGSWQFAPHWQLQAKIANAFDRDYETVYYYNQPGRTAMLTVRYTP